MRRLLALLLASLFLLASCGGDDGGEADAVDETETETEDDGSDEGTDDGGAEDEAPEGIAGVVAYDIEDNSHTEGAVDYDQSPPVAGPHNPVWANCNFYDEEIPSENAVHSLEHGAVWITFQEDVLDDDDAVDTINDLVDGSDHVLASVFEDQDDPIVLTAWNRQLGVDDLDDERVEEFLDTYLLADTSPEPGAACEGGAGG